MLEWRLTTPRAIGTDTFRAVCLEIHTDKIVSHGERIVISRVQITAGEFRNN